MKESEGVALAGVGKGKKRRDSVGRGREEKSQSWQA